MGLLRDEEILLVAKFLLIPTTRKKSTQVDANRFSLQKKNVHSLPTKVSSTLTKWKISSNHPIQTFFIVVVTDVAFFYFFLYLHALIDVYYLQNAVL